MCDNLFKVMYSIFLNKMCDNVNILIFFSKQFVRWKNNINIEYNNFIFVKQ
jgi:hypothetical protein